MIVIMPFTDIIKHTMYVHQSMLSKICTFVYYKNKHGSFLYKTRLKCQILKTNIINFVLVRHVGSMYYNNNE